MLVSTVGAELVVVGVASVVGAGSVRVVDGEPVPATSVVLLTSVSVEDGAGVIVVVIVAPLSPLLDPQAARPVPAKTAAGETMEMMILVRRFTGR